MSGGKADTAPEKNQKMSQFESGVESVQGRRPQMEDTHIVFDDVCLDLPEYKEKLSGQSRVSIYGVYDGKK